LNLYKWQEKAIKMTLNTLKRGGVVAINAPTGSGKTLLSLILAFKVKERVFSFVRTKNEFQPYIREANKMGIRPVFLVSKSSLCPYSDNEASSEDIKCKSCSLLYKVEEVYINSISDIQSIKQKGKEEGFCPYYSLREMLEKSKLSMLTYPYIFSQRIRESIGLLDIIEDSVIIIDEAHNLDNASEVDEASISLRTLELAEKQVKDLIPSKLKLFSEIINKIRGIEKYISSSEDYIKLNKEDLKLISNEELNLLEDFYEEIGKEMLRKGKITRIYIGQIIKFFEGLESGLMPFSHDNKIVLKYVDPLIYLNIINTLGPTILLSGTLPPLNYIKSVWGISKEVNYIDARDLDSSIGEPNANWYIAYDVTTKYDKRGGMMWAKYGKLIMRIFMEAKRNVLCIFPSYEVMRNVNPLISIGNKIVEDEETSVSDIEAKVREGKWLILGVARGKMSEGIEFTEEGKSLISDVVIAGIPYPRIDDYYKEKVKALSKRVNVPLRKMLIDVPTQIIVKQALGRAIRSLKDSANFWLLDKRFLTYEWYSNLEIRNATKVSSSSLVDYFK